MQFEQRKQAVITTVQKSTTAAAKLQQPSHMLTGVTTGCTLIHGAALQNCLILPSFIIKITLNMNILQNLNNLFAFVFNKANRTQNIWFN